MAAKVGGRIARIKLKGFMTYDDLEIIPVKGLNLVLGLNGSGKSSIMCAICLGLGGKPQYTGRAMQLSDFIKYNHKKAIIEIELESHCDKNEVIKHVIHMDKQLWYLNNKLVNQSKITSFIKKYNIDMGNLCQFLPQEKVAEFSKMDKKQRLVNMIQAIGDPNLLTLFDELKTLRNNFVCLEKELEELENNKVSEEKNYERLRPEVENQEDKKTLEQDLKLYKLQKIGYDYTNLNNEALKKKDECKKQKEEILRIENEQRELEAEKLKFENLHASNSHVHQTKIEELKGNICKFMQNLTACHENLQAYHAEVDNAKICFENRMQEKTEQTKKLAYLSKQMKEMTDVQQKNDLMTDLEDKLRQIANKCKILEPQLLSCESELGKLNIKKKSLESLKISEEKKIKSNEEKKYDVLRQNYPDTYEALRWLQENKSTFKSPISHPPFVSIEVQRDEDRKFVENKVGVSDLLMFICEDKDDLENFLHIMKYEKNLSLNVSMLPEESLADLQSQPITEHMRYFYEQKLTP